MAGAGRAREKAGRKGAGGLRRAALEFMVRDLPGGPVVKTVHPLQGAWVRSPVRELRSHMPQGMGQKKKKEFKAISWLSLPKTVSLHRLLNALWTRQFLSRSEGHACVLAHP